MLGLAFAGVLALAALVAFAFLVGLVRRYPPAGIGLAALVVATVWEAPEWAPLIEFAGLSVTASDVITLILFVVGVLEFTQLRANLQGWLIPWLLIGVLIAVSLLRGAATYGLAQATNEARGVLWVFFAMTWALAIRPERLKIPAASLVIGWILALVALYHGFEHGLGSPTAVVLRADGSYGPNRILIAAQAAALLLCAGVLLLTMAASGKSRTRLARSSVVFFGVILLSQHRSVWLAGLAAMTAAFAFVNSGRARGRVAVLLGTGAWLALVGFTVLGAARGVIDSALNSDTFVWRTSGWQTLVSDAIARGPFTVAFGEPFGSGFLRTVGDGRIVVQPHNWYVEIFLRLGIIGLVLFVGMLVAAVLKSRAGPPEWMFVLVAVVFYATAYSVEWYLAPWLAAAMLVSLRGGDVGVEPFRQHCQGTPAKSRLSAGTGGMGKGSSTGRLGPRGRGPVANLGLTYRRQGQRPATANPLSAPAKGSAAGTGDI